MTGIEHEADGSWLVPLLLLAAVCWQVWVTLRRPRPPHSDADDRSATAWPFSVNLVGLDHSGGAAAPQQHSAPPPRDTRFAEAVRAIRTHDHDFDLQQFLDGAAVAYETIAIAFAEGKSTALRSLVTPEVYETYAAAIAARADAGTVRTVLVRLAEPQLLDVAIRDDRAEIRVRFVGNWLSVRSSDVDTDGGAATNAAFDTADEWTFTRPLAAHDPNWVLATSN